MAVGGDPRNVVKALFGNDERVRDTVAEMKHIFVEADGDFDAATEGPLD